MLRVMQRRHPRPAPTPTEPADGIVRNPEADKEDVRRLAAFCDAVFAIAMTLLVLDLDIPDPSEVTTPAQLHEALSQWTAYGAFGLSFIVIAFYWVVHFRAFRLVKRVSSVVLWLNLVMLMGICFLPFATSVLQRFSDERQAVTLYAGVLAAIGFVWAALWGSAMRDASVLDLSAVRSPKSILWRCLMPPTVFAISMVIARFSVDWASRSWIAIFPLSVFRPRRFR